MKTVEMIVPCYNEEECIALFYARVCEVFENLKEHRFIITYIDDGSKDGTLDEIKKLVKTAEKDGYSICLFPEILERKRLFMPVFPKVRVTM